jgi:quinol monooxygenase YgiN
MYGDAQYRGSQQFQDRIDTAAYHRYASSQPVIAGRPRLCKLILAVTTLASPPMTTISSNRKLLTLINVFTVEPANQQRLLELLARATETSVRHAPGFISSSLHRGLDGTKVTMYAQWRSAEDYQAMRENPAPLPYFQEALTIAKFDPGMYEVVETYSGTATEP